MTIRDIVVLFGFDVDRNSEREAENSIKGLKSMATKLLGAIGIVFSIRGLSDLAQAAADVEALDSQFTQVFGDMEQEAASRLESIADDTGVFVNRMRGSFAQIAAFAKTTGLDQAESLELADRSMQAIADSAAFYDRSIEDVTESMRSFLKGNYENDAALGLSATETTRNAAANALYSKSFAELSEAEKQFTLLKMVEDANAASGALGQAARESDTWTNQMGNLKQAVTDLKAAVGSNFLKPGIAALKVGISLVQKATNAVKGLTSENGLLTIASERYHAVVKRMQPSIDRMSQAINRFVAMLGGADNVMKILAISAAAFLIAMNWGSVMTGAKNFVKLLSAIGKLFNFATLKVMALFAVFVLLALIVEDFFNFLAGNDSLIGAIFDNVGIGAENARKAIFEKFGQIKEFLAEAWEFLSEAASAFADTVVGFFKKHGDSILGNLQRAWGLISTFLKGAWTFLTQLAATLFGDAEGEIDGSSQSTRDKLLSIWRNILNTLSAVFSALYEAFSAVFNAFATIVEKVFGWAESFWNSWGSRILSMFKVLWDSVGKVFNGFLQVLTGVTNFISAVFNGDVHGAMEALKQIFFGAVDMIVGYLTGALSVIELLVSMTLSAVSAIWNTVWGEVSGFFIGIWNGLVSFLGSILTGVSGKVGEIKEAIIDGLEEAVEYIKGLPEEAFQWGVDMITGLANGIASAVGKVTEAVSGVAEDVKSFLHFSVPDKGPLADYESWMPDFMSGLAHGIRRHKGEVLGQIGSLASGIAMLSRSASASAATAANSTINNRSSSVVQNVNIANSYTGGSGETQRNVSKAMKKSAVDSTTQMARALAYARG